MSAGEQEGTYALHQSHVAEQSLHRLWASLCVAQEVGAGLE
jgi:hypothetical protein